MRQTRRGSVFVLALIVTAALASIVALMGSQMQLNLKSSMNRMEKQRAELMAQAGIQHALTELVNLDDQNNVNQTQTWYSLGNIGNDRFLVGDDSFRMQIIDAGSLIGLNNASEDQLRTLGLTEDQIASLLDWREQGDTPRPGGAKNEFYNNLSEPYSVAGGPLTSVEELLLVNNFTPQTLYAPLTDFGAPTIVDVYGDLTLAQLVTVDSGAPNLGSNGEAKQDINQAQQNALTQAGLSPQTAGAIIARRGQGFTGMGEVLLTPGLNVNDATILLDRFTTDTAEKVTGRVNINTAPEEVLTSLPGITSDLAESIISRQSAGIASLGELLSIPGITPALLSTSVDLMTTGSDTFIVRVVGQAGSTRVSLEGVIQMQENGPKLLETRTTHLTDMTTEWHWSDEASSDIDLGASQ